MTIRIIYKTKNESERGTMTIRKTRKGAFLIGQIRKGAFLASVRFQKRGILLIEGASLRILVAWKGALLIKGHD